MIPPADPSVFSDLTILLGCCLPCLALTLLSAYVALSSRYQYNCKLLELKLKECQINSRLSEKEHAFKTNELKAQILSLTSDDEGRKAEVDSLTSQNEEMRHQLLALREGKEELACLLAQKDAEYVQRRSELEEIWLDERDSIQRANAREIASFQVKLRSAEMLCTSWGDQIQALTQANDELQAIRMQQEQQIVRLTVQLSKGCLAAGGGSDGSSRSSLAVDTKELQDVCGRQEQKIWELTDKLSEYHRRLSSSGVRSVDFSSRPLPSPPASVRHDPRVVPTRTMSDGNSLPDTVISSSSSDGSI